jgi:CRP-like cAMP-binding protein
VSLTFGQVLYEPASRIPHVYFPYSGVISLLTVVAPTKAAEVGVVGNEGVVGGSAALGIHISHLRAVVQGAGTAARITSSRLHKELRTHGSWYRELFRFTHALMSQIAQTAACNRFHTAEARLARWLLATRDRVHSQHFHLTHEFLAHMLGVRRVGITAAANKLQKRRLIAYTRGNIQLLDPTGLEATACDCYGAVKEIYRRSYRT